MKKCICAAVVLSTLFTITNSFAEEAKVRLISTIPSVFGNQFAARNINVQVIQIEDQKNGVVCYGLAPTSGTGRGTDGGFPGTSVSCVQILKAKK